MKKGFLVVVLILLIFCNIYLIYKNEVKENKYIIFNDNNLFYLNGDYLKKQNKNKIGSLNFTDSKLYSNSINYEYVTFNIDESTYLYDSALEKLNVDDSYILTNIDNIKVKTLDSDIELTEYDKKNIINVLESNNLMVSIDNIDVLKIESSVSDSNKNETLYTIMFNSEEGNYDSFYICFAVIDNKIVEIDKKITDVSESLTVFNPIIYMLIDINNDNLDEVVIENSKFSSPEETYYCVYKYNESTNKFNLISDCK